MVPVYTSLYLYISMGYTVWYVLFIVNFDMYEIQGKYIKCMVQYLILSDVYFGKVKFEV